jgi:hypothetical protein
MGQRLGFRPRVPNNEDESREGGISVSPVVLGFGVLDAMIATQAAYAVRDLSRKKARKREK